MAVKQFIGVKRYEIRHRCPLCGQIISDVTFYDDTDWMNHKYTKQLRKDMLAVFILNHYLEKHPDNTNETEEDVTPRYGT